jgi:hypothetical protein
VASGAFVGSFAVNVAVVGDTTPPTYTFGRADGHGRWHRSRSVHRHLGDDVAVNASTLGDGDVLITGPNNNGYSQQSKLVSVTTGAGGTVTAVYSTAASDRRLDFRVEWLVRPAGRLNQVADTTGNFVANGAFLGSLP